MSGAIPGDLTYDESLERLASILKEEQRELGEIQHLSDQSLRQWLAGVLERAAARLAIPLAVVRAMLDDWVAIGANARTSFWESYHETRAAARQVKRRS